jgi:hypothetical protein
MSVIETLTQDYVDELSQVLKKQNSDPRAINLLQELVSNLIVCARLHYELQTYEKQSRVKIPEGDLENVHRCQMELQRLFMDIPNQSKSSLYETDVVLTIHSILAVHTKHDD